jgi:hypothetical protein
MMIARFLIPVCLGLGALRAAELQVLTPEETAQGWRLLFNGENLEGWERYERGQKPGPGWQVKDGVLEKLPGTPGGNLITSEVFSDYELAWEWKISPKGNNGIKYLVTRSRPGAPGPEYQLLDDAAHPDGNAGEKRQTASLYDILPPATGKKLNPPGEWNHSRIIVRGNQVEHWLNGNRVLTFELASKELKAAIANSKFKNEEGFGDKIAGHIMITDHSDGCSFRNVKILPLKP